MDREGNGAIRNIAVITEGPALGHGFSVDETLARQVAGAIEGRAGRWTHGSLFGDGLAQHLGRWTNGRLAQVELDDSKSVSVALGDFVFDKSAHQIQPDGLAVSAAEFLMTRAEEDPSTFGVSIVADLELETVALATDDEDDKDDDEDEDKPDFMTVGRLASERDLIRGDFVGDPAANPQGLSEADTSELEHLIDTLSERFGRTELLSFLRTWSGEQLLFDVPQPSNVHETPSLKESSVDYEARIAELEAQLAEEREARTALNDEFVEGLAQSSADAGNPIPKADLDMVTALFDKGESTAAKVLGEKLRALHCGRAETVANTVRLSDPEAERRAKSNRAMARAMEATGWEITLSEDGTKIIDSKPPKG